MKQIEITPWFAGLTLTLTSDFDCDFWLWLLTLIVTFDCDFWLWLLTLTFQIVTSNF